MNEEIFYAVKPLLYENYTCQYYGRFSEFRIPFCNRQNLQQYYVLARTSRANAVKLVRNL